MRSWPKCHRHGIAVSVLQLWPILDDMDLKPHKVKGWLNRGDDPEFWDRVQDVCDLYLNGPENAIVLSVDEKTGMQAKERGSDGPAGPGRPGRYEFEYRRHCTASLLAAPDVFPAGCWASTLPDNSVTFIDFLAEIDRNVTPSWTSIWGDGQRVFAHVEGNHGVGWRIILVRGSLHAQARQLGQHGAVLLDHRS